MRSLLGGRSFSSICQILRRGGKPESPGAVRRRYRCWRGAPRRPQGPPTELDPGLDLGEAGVVIKAFLGLVEIKRLLRRGNNLRRAEGERLISRLTARPPTSRCGGASEEFATNGAEFFPRAPEHSYIPVYGRKVAGSRAPREFIPISRQQHGGRNLPVSLKSTKTGKN